MKNEQRISEKITIGGVPNEIDLAQFKNRGVETIVSFLTPGEPEFAQSEQVEAAGLRHVSIPVSVDCLKADTVEKLAQTIDNANGETVLHCKGGGRAGVMALLYLVQKNDWNLEKAREEGAKFGAKIGSDSLYHSFFEEFVGRKSQN